MKNQWLHLACIACLCLHSVGCRTIVRRVESDVRSGAVSYAEHLKSKGELPGFTSDEQGEIILGDPVAVLMHSEVEYPLELILHARKSVDPDRADYVYRLMKDDPNVEWKLIGACKRVGGKNIWYKDLQEKNPQPSPGE